MNAVSLKNKSYFALKMEEIGTAISCIPWIVIGELAEVSVNRSHKRTLAKTSSQMVETYDIDDSTKNLVEKKFGSNPKELAEATNKLLNGLRLIRHAEFVMEQKEGHIPTTPEERSFVNWIAIKFGWATYDIYPETDKLTNVAQYDICDTGFVKESPFYITYSMIQSVFTDEARIYLVTNSIPTTIAKSIKTITYQNEVRDPGKAIETELHVVKPVTFDNDKLNLFNPEPIFTKKTATVTDHLYKKLMDAFGVLLNEKKYQFNKLDTGMVELVISNKEHGYYSYIIDPGFYIGGDKIYMMIYTMNGDLSPVSLEHKDIIKLALENPTYRLLPDACQIAIQDVFANSRIYQFVDMSKTKFINDLSVEDFVKLGKKLSFIINLSVIARLRFRKFAGIDSFELVSDENCASPFAYTGQTFAGIIPGLLVKVEGDKVTTIVNGVSSENTITDYNIY